MQPSPLPVARGPRESVSELPQKDRPASDGARRVARLTCAVRLYPRFRTRSSTAPRRADCGASGRASPPARSGIGFAVMRRTSLLIVPLVVAVGLSGVALAATHSAPRSSCKVTPKHGWTSCPRGNLAGRDLAQADLRNANLAGANLTGAKLTQANLATANLARAKLTRARLDNANLLFANLVGADCDRREPLTRDAERCEPRPRESLGSQPEPRQSRGRKPGRRKPRAREPEPGEPGRRKPRRVPISPARPSTRRRWSGRTSAMRT